MPEYLSARLQFAMRDREVARRAWLAAVATDLEQQTEHSQFEANIKHGTYHNADMYVQYCRQQIHDWQATH